MGEDEEATARRLAAYRDEIGLLVRQHRGRVVDSPGDNLLAEFPTATDALECAVEIQRVIAARNASLAPERRMDLRIGVHLGEITVEPDRIYGNGVNAAARLQALAEPGGICVSAAVLEQVGNKIAVAYRDLGPQSLKNIPEPVRAYHVVTGESAAPARKRVAPRAIFALAGAALLAIAAAAYFAFGGRSPIDAGASLTSIAVLPFDDMSPGGDQKWLADGMAEELTETLSRIEALRVLARTSAFAMKGRDLRTVGEELRVGSVVEGSVRRSGDQLRVTAQLIRVSDGSHLWSARYDRKLADVFALQSEIARAIAEAIRGELGIEHETSWYQSHEPSDVRAYELLKQGLLSRWSGAWPTEEGIRKAIECYELALAIDPDYANAHAELGHSYRELWVFHGRAEADLAKARVQADRALAIDPTSGTAHSLLAIILAQDYSWEEARRVVDRGLAHHPGHSALRAWSGFILANHGRTVEAQVEMRRAVDLDPWFWLWQFLLGVFQVFDGEYAAAVESLVRAGDLAPDVAPLTRVWLAYAHHRAGRDDPALEALVRDLPPDLADLEAATRRGFEAAGFTGAVRARYEWLVAKSGEPCPGDWGLLDGAGALAILGEADAMFACLAKAIERRDVVYLKADPVYEPYRSDPRFAALLRRMNLAD